MWRQFPSLVVLLMAHSVAVFSFQTGIVPNNNYRGVNSRLLSKIDSHDESMELIQHAKPTNWDSYRHAVLDPLVLKGKKHERRWINFFRGSWLARLFLREGKKVNDEAEESAKQKASQYFREKQYEQHHHAIHAPDKIYYEQTYLESIKSSVSVDAIDDVSADHRGEIGASEHYLDKLSEPKHATWGDYKGYVGKLNEENKPWKDMHGEIEELKQEVTALQDLLQMEQSMYQASNQALKLAVDAQSSVASGVSKRGDVVGGGAIDQELKEFDEKAKDFKNSVALQEEKKRPNFFGLMW